MENRNSTLQGARIIIKRMEPKKFVAIGDSFFYICTHLEESDHILQKGVLQRIQEKLPFPTELIDLGINGASTEDWLKQAIPQGDFYLILLGTNDWWCHDVPTGTREDFLAGDTSRRAILGNLGRIVKNIREVAPSAPIFLGNPVERGEFVYRFDTANHALPSDLPRFGRTLENVSKAIVENCFGERIYPIDTHSLSGFSVEKAVHFQRLVLNGKIQDVPYPEYENFPYSPSSLIYPYPKEAWYYTYDGLHPTDLGSEKLSEAFLPTMLKILQS